MSLTPLFKLERFLEDATVVIVASGPSLTTQDIRTLAMARTRRGCPYVIAVSDAIYPAWFADWLHACDLEWWETHAQMVHDFPGIKTTLSPDVPKPWVNGYLMNSGVEGFDPDPTKCRNGRNSGYQAMCIAAHIGAKKIVLLGFDMKPGPEGKSHFFGEHGSHLKTTRAEAFCRVMLPQFDSLKQPFEEMGIQVINATPGSALAVFPRVELADALR